MFQAVTFSSLETGPKFLVLGAVHGNEKCGTYAIRRILKELEEGAVVIERGSVTFVPICNQRAFDADTRFIDRNLNRYLVPQKTPDCYEAQIGNVLCPLLEACDVLLDLHSYHNGVGSFVYVGVPGSEEHAFADSLGASAGITGWSAAYAASGRPKTVVDPNESTGTTEYARRFGAIAATIECGQHKNPETFEMAYLAIRRALNYLKLTTAALQDSDKPISTKLIEVKKVFYRDQAGSLAQDWKELDHVRKGDIIAVDEHDQPLIVAPEDGRIILPNADAALGTEWVYWGQEKQ